MPRRRRKKSRSGIYHVILRGANRQEFFHSDEDRVRFLDTLLKYKIRTEMQVFAWCLMDNHLHLLLKEGNEGISHVMKRIGISYAQYYNWTYRTTGHLFEDRFRSEQVEDDRYLLTVVRYIHQNPVKAGIVRSPEAFYWNSCRGYYGMNVYPTGLLDEAFVLRIFSTDETISRKEFRKFNEKSASDYCLQPFGRARLGLTDEEARMKIVQVLGVVSIPQLKSLPRTERDVFLRRVKKIEGVSQRQAARILGVSPNLLFKA